MSSTTNYLYVFGQFRLDPAERLLLRDGAPINLTPKVFEALLFLVERHGKLLSRAEMLEALWPDTNVEENALTKSISEVRRALGPGDFVETVSKTGYRFVAPVEEVAAIGAQEPEASAVDEVAAPPLPTTAANRLRWAAVTASIALLAGAVWLIGNLSAHRKVQGDTRIETLAVLPFRPMSAQNRDQYLELAMADTLIARLSASGLIAVRPTTAIRGFLDAPSDPLEAGRSLHVDAVVDGTLGQIDGSLRLTARLIRVSDGALIWTGSEDDSFTHLFEAQDSLSQKIASALSLKQAIGAARRDTSDLGAYLACQKGRFFAGKRTPEGFGKAIDYYKEAIARDSNYAVGWSGLADAYMLSAGYFAAPANPAHARAREAAMRAITLDPQSAEAHTSMALVHENGDWDFRAADREYRRAVELNPDYATAQDWYGEFLVLMGHADEGLAHLRQAEQSDPLSPNVGGDVAFAMLHARRYDEAISEAKKVLELHPDFLRAHRALNIAYFWNRMWTQEGEELDRLSSYDGPDDTAAARALFFAASGQTDRVSAFVAQYRKHRRPADGPASREFMTCMFVLHNASAALQVLESGYDKRDAYLTSLKVGREFDRVRGDTRFQNLLRRMNFLD